MSATTGSRDVLLETLRMEKGLFWTENSHLDHAEIQRLWSRRASELASVLGDAAPPQSFPPEKTMPQSARYETLVEQRTTSMIRQRSDQPYTPTLDRSHSLSQHSAPMSRKRSNGSRLGPSPATCTNESSPLPVADWQAGNDDPFSCFTISGVSTTENPSKMQRTSSGRKPLPRVPEVSVYDDPSDYIKSTQALTPGDYIPSTTRPRSMGRRNSRGLSYSPSQQSPFSNRFNYSQSPSTPTTDGLTNATTFAEGMSRQSSMAGSEFCGGFEMMQIQSQRSQISDYNTSDAQFLLDAKPSLAPTNNCNVAFSKYNVLEYTGGIVHDTALQSAPVLPISTVLPVQSSIVEEDLDMKRSSSSESNASSQSRASRRRQIAQCERPIAPKCSEGDLAMSRRSSGSDHQMIRIKSADGSSKDVFPITKTSYNRPSKEKVKCNMCNEQPDGFRGDHELRRHHDRKHCKIRKVWVCLDLSPDKTKLANCKQCRAGKKYGAYYNAAAHLRRVHFNPRPKGRKGKSSPEERRGGKGGGEFPPMDELKNWMEEKDENAPEGSLAHSERDPSGEVDDDATLVPREEDENDDGDDDDNCNADNDMTGYDGLTIDAYTHSIPTAQTSFTTPTHSTSYRSDPALIPHHPLSTNDLNVPASLFEPNFMTETTFDDSMLFPFDSSPDFCIPQSSLFN
ncbi:hypothetical protein MMC30_008664 [Trapelia coarctata]|nr:hypothetical protein [Trapelia coarctata]